MTRGNWSVYTAKGESLQLRIEGIVYIYDGLYEADVQVALDPQRHRIDYRMFVLTRLDKNSEVSEMDDCD